MLHRAADVACDAYAAAWARLYVDGPGAQATYQHTDRTLGAEVAADVFRRTPEALGRLTPEAAQAVAQGWGRELTDAVGRTGAAWRGAERERPREPAAQVAAELQCAQLGMAPFRALDRAQAQARALARAAERALGSDREQERGGRGR